MEHPGSHPATRRTSILLLVAIGLTAIVVGLAGDAGSGRTSTAEAADSIPGGFDLFETDPEATVFRFQGKTAIPANFFGQGSQKFEGDVPFGGVPIQRFRGHDTGDADTVVQRKAGVKLPDQGPSKAVKIELVRLSIVDINPIEVKFANGGTQLWDVRAEASPSRPSTGQMTMTRKGQGGTFDSRITIYPKFTFTRVTQKSLHASAPQTKVLDVGALPDGVRPDDAGLTVEADGVPWRRGCAPPALDIAGLNDAFCPGLAPGGGQQPEPPGNLETDAHKVLTEHQAIYANHGIWPVQPRLEHFVCYTVHADTPPVFPAGQRRLVDQFRTTHPKILAPERFCNPARKRDESFKNKDAHLRCYTLEAPSFDKVVRLRNQFGPFRARVLEPQRLCLPSSKEVVGGDAPNSPIFVTEHFQCYRIKPLGSGYKSRKVKFKDQFKTFKVKVFKPSKLCAPVEKSRKFRVQHHVGHLACYAVKGPKVKRAIIVRNQYTQHRDPPEPDMLETRRVREVCIPTLKWKP